MRTGFDAFGGGGGENEVEEFERRAVALLGLLCEDVTTSSEKFAFCCGRESPCEADYLVALKYEVREFLFRDDLEDRVVAAMQRGDAGESGSENEYDNESDGSEEDNGSEEDGESGKDNGSGESGSGSGESGSGGNCVGVGEEITYLKSRLVRGDEDFHSRACAYFRGWASWVPEEGVATLLKRAVDAAEESHGKVELVF